MKVLVFVKATPNSEKGDMKPSPETTKMFEEMGKYNEQLVKAGIMKEADGLKPSYAGKRIKFSEGHVSVIDGPFAETKELVAGYWVWNVKSMDEAVMWAKRCPNPMPGEEGVLEIRPTYSTEEFDDLLTDEIRERFDRTGAEMERQKSAKPKSKARKKAAPAPRKKARKARSKK